MIKYKYILFLAVLAFASCRKAPPIPPPLTEVYGVAKDYYTGKVIDSAYVWIGEFTSPFQRRGGISVRTDANGFFSLKFEDERFSKPHIIISKGYYYYSTTDINKVKKNYLFCSIKGYGIRFHIKNQNPFDDNDTRYTNKSYKGKNVNAYIDINVDNTVRINLNWEVTKNNITLRKDTSLKKPQVWVVETFDINY